MLEAALRTDNSFVTLTYKDDPVTLNPKHTQDWLKRLRKALSIKQITIRYYLVGEYGDQTNRPHYHVALFGYPPCDFGNSRYSKRRTDCCPACDLVRDTWQHGHVFLGSLETTSAQYIAGYVTKKLTAKDDPRLGNRHPEFARMSLRPGIGVAFLHDVASEYLRLNLVDSEADVPSALRHGSRLLPLGVFMRRKLRTFVGLEPNAPQSTQDEAQAEVLALWDSLIADTKNFPGEVRKTIFKNALIDQSANAVAQMENRAKIYKQRRSL